MSISFISCAHTQIWLPLAYGGCAASARPPIRRFALHLRMEAPWVGTFPAIRRPSAATAGRRGRIRKTLALRSEEVPREFRARNRSPSWLRAVQVHVQASGRFLGGVVGFLCGALGPLAVRFPVRSGGRLMRPILPLVGSTRGSWLIGVWPLQHKLTLGSLFGEFSVLTFPL